MLSLQTTSTAAQTYPSSSSSPTSPRERESDSLSHRCRRLAASIGASAKAEQQFDQLCRPLTTLSNRVSPPVSPAKASSNSRSPLPPPPSPSSSLSTSLSTSPTRSLEASFTLQEIYEDPMEDGKEEGEELEDEGMKTPVSRGVGGLGLTGLDLMRGSSDSLSLEFQGGARGLSRITETLDQLGGAAVKGEAPLENAGCCAKIIISLLMESFLLSSFNFFCIIVEDRLTLVRDALKHGVDTLEVKVWLVEGELLVSHFRISRHTHGEVQPVLNYLNFDLVWRE